MAIITLKQGVDKYWRKTAIKYLPLHFPFFSSAQGFQGPQALPPRDLKTTPPSAAPPLTSLLQL
jgi:hypothetical protein